MTKNARVRSKLGATGLSGAVAFLASVAISPTAYSNDDVLCGAYAAVGEVMSGEVLDVTMRDFILMARGENPELQQRIGVAMADAWTGTQLIALSEMGEDRMTLLSEAAGQTAMVTLMQGGAASSEELGQLMNQHCMSIGIEQIMVNQQAASDAAAANMSVVE